MTPPLFKILGFTEGLKIVKQKGEPQTTLEVEKEEKKLNLIINSFESIPPNPKGKLWKEARKK